MRDESGQPVAFEPVTLTVQGRTFSTFTEGFGEYRFYGTPSGQGTITVDRHTPVEIGPSRPAGLRHPAPATSRRGERETSGDGTSANDWFGDSGLQRRGW